MDDGDPQKINLGLGRIGGIEFSAFDENIIYASCADGGIVAVNYITGNVENIYSIPPDHDFGKTFLQTAPDGHIYGVSNNGNQLGRIYQYDVIADNKEAGDFVPDAFSFPQYHQVATTKDFGLDGTYYILPENGKTYVPLEAEAFPVDVSCPGYTDGSVKIYVSGGVPFDAPDDPYTISTVPEITTFEWDEDEQCFEASDLWKAEYTYTITDSFGNPIIGMFIIDVDFSDYTYGDHEIIGENTQITFNDEIVSFAKGFTVPEGVIATFNNSTVLMGPLASIYVEAGTVEDLGNGIAGVNAAKLIVNNTTITNHAACNDEWQGIQVRGISDQSQLVGADGFMYQGKLVVENNSYIKNAINAVTTQEPGNTDSHGGIVLAVNSTFRNNKRSIEMLSYENFNPYGPDIKLPYVNQFHNCTFVINNDYIIPETMEEHVYLSEVRGIKFTGCTFSNYYMAQYEGIGINSLDAGYSLLTYCSSTATPCPEIDVVHCSFHNLHEGIHAANTDYCTNTIFVNNADFINNSIGVFISAVDYAIVINSDFEVGYNEGDKGACGDLTSGFGIDIHESIGFVFENNDFTKYVNAPTDTYTGIRVYKCKSPHDIIYKNTFDGLSFGNYAEGQNRQYAGIDLTGVEYRCNKNFTNAIDFQVDNINENPKDGMIRDFQGDESIAAGNWFSQESVNLMHFVNLGTQIVTFKYYENDPNYMIPNLDKITDYVQISTDENIAENLCPDNHGGGGNIKMSSSERTDKETVFANNLADYNSVLSLYQSFENGGNTTSELLDIETAQPDDMWTLRAQLLGDSPHLSQEVLMNISDRTDVFPDDVLFDILAANPDELKEDTLISYLENKEDPLPDYMINILKQLAYTNTTYKTILINDMAYYYGKKMQAAKSIVHSILSDSVVDQTDFRNWLDNMECIEADKQIVASYLSENDTVNAISLLGLIPSLYELEGDGLDDFNDYKDLLLIQLSWKNQGKTIFDLDSTDILTLEYYADNTTGDASSNAKNILSFAYNYYYCDCLSSNDSTYFKSASSSSYPIHTNFGISVFANPNPASTWAAFDYTLANDESIGIINITDITGKEVTAFDINGKQGQLVWDTRTVKPGVYIYTMTSSGSSTSGKLIIK